MVLPIIFSCVTMCGVIYLAVSRRSSNVIKFSALGALALMIITVIVCLLVFFKSSGPKPLILPDTLPEDIPPPPAHNTAMLVMFIIFMIGLFVAVLVFALRGQDQERKENW